MDLQIQINLSQFFMLSAESYVCIIPQFVHFRPLSWCRSSWRIPGRCSVRMCPLGINFPSGNGKSTTLERSAGDAILRSIHQRPKPFWQCLTRFFSTRVGCKPESRKILLNGSFPSWTPTPVPPSDRRLRLL